MHIHATHRGKSKNRCMQNAPVGCDGDQIRLPGRKSLQKFRCTDLQWLEDRNMGTFRHELHQRGDELMPSPLRSIRLRHHSDDLVIRTKECLERWYGEF